MKEATVNQNNIEEKIKALEKIIEDMEGTDITLGQSMALYKEGTEMIKACHAIIEEVEKEITIIEEKNK